MHPIGPDDIWALRVQVRRLERQLASLHRVIERAAASGAGVSDLERLAYDSHFPVEVLYHITPASYYAQLPGAESYVPREYAKDGFIHCTRGADLLVLVANKYYRSVSGDFLMLVIDPAALTAPLKYEMLDSQMPYRFPHIYGPLNRDAIIEVVKMVRAADGTFLAPPYDA